MLTTEPYRVPFTLLIDTAESQPFTFQGLKGDANIDNRPLIVPTQFVALGRYPHSIGDYSVAGYSDRVAVERKSMEDAWGTVFGWETEYQIKKGLPGRRERFEKELENLSKLEASTVVVEADFDVCLRLVPEWGKKSADLNRKIFFRSVLAFMQDYKVPWLFCGSRRIAEIATFQFLKRFVEKDLERRKAEGSQKHGAQG